MHEWRLAWLDSPTTAQGGSTLAFCQLLQMWGKGKETEVRLERCQQSILKKNGVRILSESTVSRNVYPREVLLNVIIQLFGPLES